MRGVNVPELKARVDLLLFEAFPRKPHHHLLVCDLTGIAGPSPCTFITLSAIFGGGVNRPDRVQNHCFS